MVASTHVLALALFSALSLAAPLEDSSNTLVTRNADAIAESILASRDFSDFTEGVDALEAREPDFDFDLEERDVDGLDLEERDLEEEFGLETRDDEKKSGKSEKSSSDSDSTDEEEKDIKAEFDDETKKLMKIFKKFEKMQSKLAKKYKGLSKSDKKAVKGKYLKAVKKFKHSKTAKNISKLRGKEGKAWKKYVKELKVREGKAFKSWRKRYQQAVKAGFVSKKAAGQFKKEVKAKNKFYSSKMYAKYERRLQRQFEQWRTKDRVQYKMGQAYFKKDKKAKEGFEKFVKEYKKEQKEKMEKIKAAMEKKAGGKADKKADKKEEKGKRDVDFTDDWVQFEERDAFADPEAWAFPEPEPEAKKDKAPASKDGASHEETVADVKDI